MKSEKKGNDYKGNREENRDQFEESIAVYLDSHIRSILKEMLEVIIQVESINYYRWVISFILK